MSEQKTQLFTTFKNMINDVICQSANNVVNFEKLGGKSLWSLTVEQIQTAINDITKTPENRTLYVKTKAVRKSRAKAVVTEAVPTEEEQPEAVLTEVVAPKTKKQRKPKVVVIEAVVEEDQTEAVLTEEEQSEAVLIEEEQSEEVLIEEDVEEEVPQLIYQSMPLQPKAVLVMTSQSLFEVIPFGEQDDVIVKVQHNLHEEPAKPADDDEEDVIVKVQHNLHEEPAEPSYDDEEDVIVKVQHLHYEMPEPEVQQEMPQELTITSQSLFEFTPQPEQVQIAVKPSSIHSFLFNDTHIKDRPAVASKLTLTQKMFLLPDHIISYQMKMIFMEDGCTIGPHFENIINNNFTFNIMPKLLSDAEYYRKMTTKQQCCHCKRYLPETLLHKRECGHWHCTKVDKTLQMGQQKTVEHKPVKYYKPSDFDTTIPCKTGAKQILDENYVQKGIDTFCTKCVSVLNEDPDPNDLIWKSLGVVTTHYDERGNKISNSTIQEKPQIDPVDLFESDFSDSDDDD